MYRPHFGLTRLPFEAPADSAELFASEDATETASRLRHWLDLRGIGLLTGEPGCGKTSACRRFADSLHDSLYSVAYVRLTTGTVIDTYQAVGWALGLETPRYRAPACQLVRREIERLGEAGKLPLLIIDEAHYLRHEVLDELRLLVNFGLDSQRLLCLLLVGQSELRRRLALAHHEALAQRIVMRYHLNGLRREELEPYLRHALARAGCQLELFEPAACQALFQASHGLPRQVSGLAHFALAAAALDQARTVSAEHVRRACEELRP